MERILTLLEDKQSSFNIKELLLSIIQRATVYKFRCSRHLTRSKEEPRKSSYWLLQELMSESSIQHLFIMLQRHLDCVVNYYQNAIDNCQCVLDGAFSLAASSLDAVLINQFTSSSFEISNNCFLLLSRLFIKYTPCRLLRLRSRVVTSGRGGYNSCFNAKPIPIQEMVRMGGIQNKEWMQVLVTQCRQHLCSLFNTMQRVVIVGGGVWCDG